jgi:hypothetical protein
MACAVPLLTGLVMSGVMSSLVRNKGKQEARGCRFVACFTLYSGTRGQRHMIENTLRLCSNGGVDMTPAARFVPLKGCWDDACHYPLVKSSFETP